MGGFEGASGRTTGAATLRKASEGAPCSIRYEINASRRTAKTTAAILTPLRISFRYCILGQSALARGGSISQRALFCLNRK
jgi:hypothetical protein